MEFLRNFPRQYLNTDSFHLHLCPYSKGEEKAARQWIIPSYDQPAGFSINIQLIHVNPRMFALPLPWIRGWISTFCPVFRRLHTGRERRGCICCNRSPDWVMSCNNSADWRRRLSGLRWRYTKTNRRDRNAHYTGVNGHNRPVCLCLMPPTNKQQPGRWWKSLHRNSDVGFYVCVLSRAFIHPSPFVSESGEWSSVIEERKHKLWASDGVCNYFNNNTV